MIKKIFKLELCPICSTRFTTKNKSKEHVFPQWLLKKCSLYNEKLTLINGTTIAYKNVVIPCCRKCNNSLGFSLEQKVEKIFKKELKLTKDEEYLLVVWLIKIYLSVRYLEQRLPFDRTGRIGGNILPENFLDDQNQIMFSIMRNFGKKINMQNNPPWSLFRYKISKKEKETFWYYDPINLPFVSIQIKQVGFVCLLTDGGGQASVLDKPYKQNKRKRFSLQVFIELTAMHLYKELLREDTPHFVTMENKKIANILNLNFVFQYKEWKHTEYLEMKKKLFDSFNKHILI